MPIFTRSGGQWVEAAPFHRDGGAWTDGDDIWFIRDGVDWDQFWPDPGAAGSLSPPQALTVSNVDHSSADVSWLNPTQTTDPTHIQIRIAELGAPWAEFDYPATSWSFSALDASTEYVLQIRYIVRTDGLQTDASAIVTTTFTTSAAPVGAPAPDPGGSGGDTIFPSGGNTGNPTPPSTVGGCWWEIRVQELSQAAFTWSSHAINTLTSDDGSTAIAGEYDGDVAEFDLDLSTLTAGRIYRVCRREACDNTLNGTADTFGDWECGLPFPAPTNWDVACGGFPDSTTVTGVSATADAAFRWPKFCLDPTGDEMVLIEAVGGTEVRKGDGFFSFFTDADGEQGISSQDTSSPLRPTALASLTALNAITQSSDWTFVTRFRALASHSGVNGRFIPLAIYATFSVTLGITESATGWTPTAKVHVASGGFLTLTGTEIPYDNALHMLTLTWDADGDKILYVDGTNEASDTSGTVTIYQDFDTAEFTYSALRAVSGMVNMQQLGWNRALSAAEVQSFTLVEVVDSDFVTNAPSQTNTASIVAGAGDLLIMPSHERSTGTAVATSAGSKTNISSVTTEDASDRYDTSGVSDGATALFSAQATAAGTTEWTPDADHAGGLIAFPAGSTISQQAHAKGTSESVSVSLGSAPSGRVIVILMSGGQQSAYATPSASGWDLLNESKEGNTASYVQHGFIYEGTNQTFAVTLPTGAVSNGGWSAYILEIA